MPAKMTQVRPNAFYVPSPVLFFGTRDASGTPDVSTMSAVGVVCLDPPIVAVGVKPSRRSYRNAVDSGCFTLSLTLEEQLEAADFVGTRKLRRMPDKLDAAGIELVDMDLVSSPAVAGSPIWMGCELVRVIDRAALDRPSPISHHVLLGQMVECQVAPDYIEDGEVRIEQIPTILYLNRYYAGIGERLGVQRFTDDPDRQRQKMTEYRRIL